MLSLLLGFAGAACLPCRRQRSPGECCVVWFGLSVGYSPLKPPMTLLCFYIFKELFVVANYKHTLKKTDLPNEPVATITSSANHPPPLAPLCPAHTPGPLKHIPDMMLFGPEVFQYEPLKDGIFILMPTVPLLPKLTAISKYYQGSS